MLLAAEVMLLAAEVMLLHAEVMLLQFQRFGRKSGATPLPLSGGSEWLCPVMRVLLFLIYKSEIYPTYGRYSSHCHYDNDSIHFLASFI